jgi:hypothetical protein
LAAKSFGAPEDFLTLESVDCRLKLADLYEKVEFAAAELPPPPSAAVK